MLIKLRDCTHKFHGLEQDSDKYQK